MDWLKYRKPKKDEITWLIVGSLFAVTFWYIFRLIGQTGKQ